MNLFHVIGTAIIASVLTTAIIAMVTGGSVGGATRFPNSDVTVKSLALSNSTATTTLNVAKVCFVGKEADGDTIYAFFNAAGTFATSSASCL